MKAAALSLQSAFTMREDGKGLTVSPAFRTLCTLFCRRNSALLFQMTHWHQLTFVVAAVHSQPCDCAVREEGVAPNIAKHMLQKAVVASSHTLKRDMPW